MLLKVLDNWLAGLDKLLDNYDFMQAVSCASVWRMQPVS